MNILIFDCAMVEKQVPNRNVDTFFNAILGTSNCLTERMTFLPDLDLDLCLVLRSCLPIWYLLRSL